MKIKEEDFWAAVEAITISWQQSLYTPVQERAAENG